MTYSPFRHLGSVLWKRRPIQLTFFLTRRCNARCPFCFYLSRNNGSLNTSELSLGEIRKVSASLGTLLWLAFSGGETFLRDDLVEIASAFYKNNRPAIILLPTNGLLPGLIQEKTEALLKHCKKSTVVVKLSLDGPEEIHGQLRGVKGAFQKMMETYRKLSGFLGVYPNFELGINSVFCSANQDRMEGLVKFVQELDSVRTHTVSMIRGNVSDEALKEVDIAKYRDISKLLERSLKKRTSGMYGFGGARLKAAQDILQRRMIYETALQKRRLIPCYAGRLNLVLTEAGDVYPCETFENRMGNVRESGYDVGKILRTGKARAAIQSIKNGGCFCTHECYFMTNILFNPLLYPSLLREYVQV